MSSHLDGPRAATRGGTGSGTATSTESDFLLDHAGTGRQSDTASKPPKNLPSAAEEVDRRGASLLNAVIRGFPPLFVIVCLGALGAVGHHYDWSLPKFSQLVGKLPVAEPAWCEEHGVPEAVCIACRADLMPKGQLHGWCQDHGVHECTLHHPELIQLKDPVAITDDDFQRAARALALRPRATNNPSCKLHPRRIQFASLEAAEKAGVDIAIAERSPLVEAIKVPGEAIYDPTQVARVSSRADGNVWRVERKVGDQVAKGDVLAVVDSAEVGRTKAELLDAVAQLRLHEQTLNRLAKLEGVVPGKNALEAEAARMEAEADVRKAVQSLQNMGLPISLEDVHRWTRLELVEEIYRLGIAQYGASQEAASRPATANMIPIVAPRDGVIVACDVVDGEMIDTTEVMFVIVDISRMWLMMSVPLEEAKYVASGQQVVFRADGGDQDESGTISWLSTEADAETRTVKVRASIPNTKGRLRNETFGIGRIILRDDPQAVVVPSSAVHWEGCCHVVFVRDKDWFTSPYKVFHTRSVRPGIEAGAMTEIIAGLWPGEVVVTQGSGALRAELLKGNLGAG